MTIQFYGIKQAAQYLGVSVATLKYHVHISKTIHPARVGHSLVFTQEQLDKFKRDRRKPGRPHKENKQ